MGWLLTQEGLVAAGAAKDEGGPRGRVRLPPGRLPLAHGVHEVHRRLYPPPAGERM